MSLSSERQILVQLASQAGIEPSYESHLGGAREASTESLIAVLQALGVPVKDTLSNLSSLHAAFRREHDERICEPVYVCWGRKSPRIELKLPKRFLARRVLIEIQGDTGNKWEVESLPTYPGGQRAVIELQRLPYGYYELNIHVGRKEISTFLIVAPVRVYEGPTFMQGAGSLGLFSPVYSLYSKQSLGVGDLTDFARFMSWAAQMGCSFVGTLPLFACFLSAPNCEPSPYSPATRLFWNELFLDPRVDEEWESSRAAGIAESASFLRSLAPLRKGRFVDYQEAYALKRRLLNEMSKDFFSAGRDTSPMFVQFLNDEQLVDDYARFRAAGEKLGIHWTKWTGAVRERTIRSTDFDMDNFHFHLYSQWLISKQLLSLQKGKHPPLLYLDFPLGLHPDAYDIWSYPSSFAQGVFAGCPPDKGHPEGQHWGIVPLHPAGIRRDNYKYLRHCIGKQMRYSGMLRLDHIMSLYRLYWVPQGLAVNEGVYVRYPCEDLFAMLSVESHRHKCILVGEALGTVPAEIIEMMRRHKILRMYVQQRSIRTDSKGPIREPSEDSIAYFGTHDQPTFKGFWEYDDLKDKWRLGHITSRELKNKVMDRKSAQAASLSFLRRKRLLRNARETVGDIMLAFFRLLSRSNAVGVLVNVEDLWLEAKPQNTPTTRDERPNWRRKHKFSIEQIAKRESISKLLQVLLKERRARRNA